jgi:ABC-type phosphate/phosphonate transport system substrate-binding protein
VVAAGHLPDILKRALYAVLYTMGDEPDSTVWDQLNYGFVARFVPITDATYDDIRAMVAAAEAADFVTLGAASPPD